MLFHIQDNGKIDSFAKGPVDLKVPYVIHFLACNVVHGLQTSQASMTHHPFLIICHLPNRLFPKVHFRMPRGVVALPVNGIAITAPASLTEMVILSYIFRLFWYKCIIFTIYSLGPILILPIYEFHLIVAALIVMEAIVSYGP